MLRSLSLFAAAFLNDAALYLVFAALPFRALDLGAGPVELGALPTLYAAAYMFSAALGGRLSDRVPRLLLARLGCLAFVGGAFLLAASPTLPTLFTAVPTLGLALGFFWSPVQATLADRAPEGRLPRWIAAFNVSWSLGKGAGLAFGGLLTEAYEPRVVLLLASAPTLLTAFLLPRDREPEPGGEPTPEPEPPARPAPFARAQYLAWMTNALAFGLVNTVNMHAPRFLLSLGAGPSAFGILTGSVFVVQTLTFLVLLRRRPAPDRASTLALGLGVLAAVLFVLLPGVTARFLAVLPFGIATGIAYDASLHASLHREQGRGKAAGLHEGILGAGTSTIPLLAGAAALGTGSVVAPFWVAAGLLGLGLLVASRLRRPAV